MTLFALRKTPPEVCITLGMLALMMALALGMGLPIIIPGGQRAAFVGVHYLYPLIGIGIWGIFALLGQKKYLAQTFLIAFPCYAIMMWTHFNIKLWAPYINPYNFDAFYWQIDQMLKPVVDACTVIRWWLDPIIPVEGNFYMIGFIALFYTSFCYHAFWAPHSFRKIFLGAMIFQGLGTIAYLPFPACGPFLYEHGVSVQIAGAQQSMLAFHHEMLVHGPQYLIEHGPTNLTAGLAAMPSLHTGGAFLFFLFALKYGRVLLPLYSLILLFIIITAVASRWHYLIDIPVGLALGWISVWLAEGLEDGFGHVAANKES